MAFDIVRVFLIKEHHRVRVQDKAGATPVDRGLVAQVVHVFLVARQIGRSDGPVAHDKECSIALHRHRHSLFPRAAIDARIHITHHFTQLGKGVDHALAAHRLNVGLLEGFAIEVDIHAVNNAVKGCGVGPIGRAMRNADFASGNDFVASRVEFIPSLWHVDAQIGQDFFRAVKPIDAVNVHRGCNPMPGRLHHRNQLGCDNCVPPFCGGEFIQIGGLPSGVPLGNFGALELNCRRSGSRHHVRAQLGKSVRGMPRNGCLLPFAASGFEHLAQLGNGCRFRALRPLVHHVGLRFRMQCQRADAERQCGQCGGAKCGLGLFHSRFLPWFQKTKA